MPTYDSRVLMPRRKFEKSVKKLLSREGEGLTRKRAEGIHLCQH